MDWLINLYSFVASLAVKLYVAADTVAGWWYPFNQIAPLLETIADIVRSIFFALTDFAGWVWDLEERVKAFVSQDWVQGWLQDPLGKVAELWSWFSSWWGNVTSVVTSWWLGVQSTILGWVDTAKTYALGLVNNLQGVFNSLQSAWNIFYGTVLPGLASRFDVTQLIEGALAPWRDLFNFWGMLGHEVTSFFADPVEFVWQRFTSWFFGGD